jgi:hypothetical protein
LANVIFGRLTDDPGDQVEAVAGGTGQEDHVQELQKVRPVVEDLPIGNNKDNIDFVSRANDIFGRLAGGPGEPVEASARGAQQEGAQAGHVHGGGVADPVWTPKEGGGVGQHCQADLGGQEQHHEQSGKIVCNLNLIVSVAGLGEQTVAGEQGEHGDRRHGTAQHEGGASAGLWDGGVVGSTEMNNPVQDERVQGGSHDEQAVDDSPREGGGGQGQLLQLRHGLDTTTGGDQEQVQPHGVRGGGEAAVHDQIRNGGGGGDREVRGGRAGGHAQVKDGFGGGVLKRAYWKKRLVPDGLVQQRIFEFSTKNKNSGVVGQHLTTSIDRKRKWDNT